ncbi:hypothetical protein [Arthrobacter sp. AQ5-05]|uniref:hypothetical protein n=1 Tax=Arthrobacter sp. AQ5-05 TaxID=2184581 RepID=UPI0011BF54B0|nr:hypothetical protein [Arthrobacter sp. AQ5-05]
MVAELRRTLEGQSQDIAPHVRERLEEIIQGAVHTIETGAEIVAVGLPDLAPEPVDLAPVEPAVVELAAAEPEPAEPAPAAAKPASDPFRHGAHAEANRLTKARELARWLWDRNISGEQVLGFTNKWRNKIARAAGVNPPSTLETWTVAVDLMTRMEELAASGTQPEASERHHLDEHEQWATEG